MPRPLPETRLIARIDRLATFLDRTGMAIAWWSGAVLVILVLVEVVSRPLNLPFFFGSELGSSLMAWLTFFALSEVGRRRGHISARFLIERLPGRARRLIDAVFSGVFFLAYVLLLFAVAVDLAATSLADGTRSQGMMRVPISWPQFGMVVGVGFFVLRTLLNTAAEITASITGRDLATTAAKAEGV